MYDKEQLNCFKSSFINNSDSICFKELDQAISTGRISTRSKKNKIIFLECKFTSTEYFVPFRVSRNLSKNNLDSFLKLLAETEIYKQD